MVKYMYGNKELLIEKANYADGHLCIIIHDDDDTERLSTNFSKRDCGRELKDNEIWICMTPGWEHPIVRGLALDMAENGFINCTYDFIRTYNEYYRYIIPKNVMEMLESDEIITYEAPEDEEDDDCYDCRFCDKECDVKEEMGDGGMFYCEGYWVSDPMDV